MTEEENPSVEAASPAVIQRRVWSLPRRIAFRFCFCFLIFVFLPQPFGSLPRTEPVFEAYDAAWKAVTPWVGENLLHLSEPVAVALSGSGDMTHNWIMLLCQLAISLVVAVLVRARPAPDDQPVVGGRPQGLPALRARVHHVHLRLRQGFPRAIPAGRLRAADVAARALFADGPAVGLHGSLRGIYPLRRPGRGDRRPLAALSAHHPARQPGLRRGAGERGGAQLFYDVPVKLFSAELLLAALFLMVPDAARLANLLVLNRPAPAGNLAMPPAPRRFVIGARVAKAALLVTCFSFLNYFPKYPWLPKGDPPLFGIYEVETFELDGKALPATQTEPQRWRRVFFGRYRGFTAQKDGRHHAPLDGQSGRRKNGKN